MTRWAAGKRFWSAVTCRRFSPQLDFAANLIPCAHAKAKAATSRRTPNCSLALNFAFRIDHPGNSELVDTHPKARRPERLLKGHRDVAVF